VIPDGATRSTRRIVSSDGNPFSMVISPTDESSQNIFPHRVRGKQTSFIAGLAVSELKGV
jgi:hypothetical protein